MTGTETGRLTLRLFGAFEARLADAPFPRLRTRKARWLLALLALRSGQELQRDWLAGLLWPDSPEPAALSNLRSVLQVAALGEFWDIRDYRQDCFEWTQRATAWDHSPPRLRERLLTAMHFALPDPKPLDESVQIYRARLSELLRASAVACQPASAGLGPL